MIWNPEARLFYDDDIGEEDEMMGCLAVLMALLLIIGSCRGWGCEGRTHMKRNAERDERTCGYFDNLHEKVSSCRTSFWGCQKIVGASSGSFCLLTYFPQMSPSHLSSTRTTSRWCFTRTERVSWFLDILDVLHNDLGWFYKKIANYSFVFKS